MLPIFSRMDGENKYVYLKFNFRRTLLLPCRRLSRCTFPWFLPLRTAQILTARDPGPKQWYGGGDPGFSFCLTYQTKAEGAGNPGTPAGTDKNKTQQKLFSQPQGQEWGSRARQQTAIVHPRTTGPAGSLDLRPQQAAGRPPHPIPPPGGLRMPKWEARTSARVGQWQSPLCPTFPTMVSVETPSGIMVTMENLKLGEKKANRCEMWERSDKGRSLDKNTSMSNYKPL